MNNKYTKYFKEDFLRSEKFKKDKDLLNAILEENKKYTKTEVENRIKKYFEGVI